jgi:multiple sugar transport system permease protein
MTAPSLQKGEMRIVKRTRKRPGERMNWTLTLALGLFAVYCLLPLWWVFVNMFKDNPQLFTSFGLWFSSPSHFFENLSTLFTREDGIFWTWLRNSFIYAGSTAVLTTIVCALGGYGFSKYNFAGKGPLFALILGTIMVPSTALVLPIFLLMQKLELINTYWAVILPSVINPFGLYLMRVFWDSSLPDELMEAARIDGAGHWTIFWEIGLPLVRGGLVTVGLFSFVASWNNFFLPLVVVSKTELFPMTLGLSVWNTVSTGQPPIYPVIILGSLISILPLIIGFLTLGRFWQGGLGAGAVKG